MDVAILFEAQNLQLLQADVVARQAAARAPNPNAAAVSGDMEEVRYPNEQT